MPDGHSGGLRFVGVMKVLQSHVDLAGQRLGV